MPGPTGRPESMMRSLFWMRELHPAVPRGFRKGTPAVLGLQVSLERFWRAGRSIYGGFRGDRVHRVCAKVTAGRERAVTKGC